jgi:hypothetical protein
MVALLALPDVEEDRERRARGVSVDDWLDAPAPPDTRYECEDPDAELELVDAGYPIVVPARPCLALRCRYHLGRVGERAGVSCWLDFIDNTAPEERTHEAIGKLLGVTLERVIEIVRDACHAFESQEPQVLVQLGVRRRHA